MAAIDINGGVPSTTLNGGITSGTTSITVADGTGYPDGTNGNFYIVVSIGLAAEETIECSARSGNVFTVATRGADGTSATGHATGASVDHVVPALTLQEANTHANQTTGTPHGSAYVTPSGNVATATALETGRTIQLTGDVTGTSGTFDGTANAIVNASLAADSVDTPELVDGAVTGAKIDSTTTVTAGGLTVDTDTLHVDATNNRVGIGTTTPVDKLEVAGSIQISEVTPRLVMKDTNSTGTSNAQLQFTDSTDAILFEIQMSATNDLFFAPGGTNTFAMTDTGRLGVGTTTPDSQFHTISSTSRAFVFDRQQDLGTNNVTCGIMKMGTDADNAGTGDYWIQFRRGDSTVVGSIRGTGSASVNYDTTSDQTLKTDLGVTSQEDTAAIIDSLTVHNFDWIDARPGLGSQIGLFAQEAMPHLPDSIVSDSDTDEDGNYIPASLDYSKIVPILIAEIQFLRERVAALEP